MQPQQPLWTMFPSSLSFLRVGMVLVLVLDEEIFLFSTVTLKNVVAFLQNIFENNIVPILGKSLDKHCSCYCLNNSAKISTPTFPPPEFSFSHPFQAESHFCSLLPSCGNISSPSSFPLTSALPPFSKSRACFWFLARWVNNDGKLLLGRLDSF